MDFGTEQPGEPRTPETSTGIKDRVAQFWIEVVLLRAQAERKQRVNDKTTRDTFLNDKTIKGGERKALKEQIVVDIQRETWEWLVCQPSESLDKNCGNSSQLAKPCEPMYDLATITIYWRRQVPLA